MRESLKAELAKATAELKAHIASWEYAFAMAGGCHGGRDHRALGDPGAHRAAYGPLQRAPRPAG